MKIVRVNYTSREDYVLQNQFNIKAVMSDLKTKGHKGINYTCCLGADGKTFTHTAFFKSEEDQQLLNALSSFKYFQMELQRAGFEVAPKQELLNLVGSNTEIFNL
jgi:hypothetical protein